MSLWKPPLACSCEDCSRPNVEPANVPLAVQEWLLEHLQDNALLEIGDLLLDCGDELIDLARERLRSGYKQYGSAMYGWDEETRRRNVMEELSDAIVYLTSGPID